MINGLLHEKAAQQFAEERRVIGSFLHGSMANALPHAIGASMADPSRQVVALAGDGGLSRAIAEAATVVPTDSPVAGSTAA